MVKKENLVVVFILKMITKKRKRGGAFPRGHGYFALTNYFFILYLFCTELYSGGKQT